MTKEALARVIYDALKAQEGIHKLRDSYLAVDMEDGLRHVWCDGPADFISVADTIIKWQESQKALELHPIKSVLSCPTKPVVKITWGDDVVTYAHFSEKAELVHHMGTGEAIERRGTVNPDDAANGVAA